MMERILTGRANSTVQNHPRVIDVSMISSFPIRAVFLILTSLFKS